MAGRGFQERPLERDIEQAEIGHCPQLDTPDGSTRAFRRSQKELEGGHGREPPIRPHRHAGGGPPSDGRLYG